MNRVFSLSLLSMALTFTVGKPLAATDIKISLDPASPTNTGAITPGDILTPGIPSPSVLTEATALGLFDDFAGGNYDNVDAISYGKDFIEDGLTKVPLFFTVDRVSVGLPGTEVRTQADLEQAAGDIFVSSPGTNSNSVVELGPDLGLQGGFFGDAIDALEMDSNGPRTYFSIDTFSATNGFGTMDLASDIYMSRRDGTYTTFASGLTNIFLRPGDNIDAIALDDTFMPGVLNPGRDLLLFSLAPLSPTLEAGGWSPADVLFTDFGPRITRFMTAQEMGLSPADNIEGLDTPVVPEASTWLLLGTGLLALILVQRHRAPRRVLAGASGVGTRVFSIGALLLLCVSTARAQTPVFRGNSPPFTNSSGLLVLRDDVANQKEFWWVSTDNVLLAIDTGGFIAASKWLYSPATPTIPARLDFMGTSPAGVVFQGRVLFGTSNSAQVDVVRNNRRLRYLLRGGIADLDGDANHDIAIEQAAADDDPEDTLPGVITLCNVDDDNGNRVADNRGADAGTLNPGGVNDDLGDMVDVLIRRIPSIPAGWTITLTLNTPQNLAAGLTAADAVRIFSRHAAPNGTPILGPGLALTFTLPAAAAAHRVDQPTLRAGDIQLFVEGLEFAGEVKLRLDVRNAANTVVGTDQIQLKVSPLLLNGHLQPVIRTYVSRIAHAESNNYCNTLFFNAVPLAAASKPVIPGPVLAAALNGTNDQWAQDLFQICFQQSPYKDMYVALESKRGRGLRAFPALGNGPVPPGLLAPDFGHLLINDGTVVNSLDSFGNLEVSPPCTVGGRNYPFGRIYYGDGGAAGRRMDADLRAFWTRQRITGQPPIQDPVILNSDWLVVGHVDEILTIIPDAGGTFGWRVLLADPLLGAEILTRVAGTLNVPRYNVYGIGAALDRVPVTDLLGKALEEPVPAGSPTVRAYARAELADIILGPAPARNGGLRQAIRAGFGLAATDIISVPVLFDRRLHQDPPGTPFRRDAQAITPDLANGAVVNTRYVAPDPFLSSTAAEEDTLVQNFIRDVGEADLNGNGLHDSRRDPFQEHLNGVLPGGFTARYIDNFTIYHRAAGEVHCGSNEIRDIPAVTWY